MNKEMVIAIAHEASPDMTWYAAIENPDQASHGELAFLMRFATLVEQRTHTNNKARWYQEGVEAWHNNPDPLHLSRILHELAGAASMCWTPIPTGVFDTEKAIEHVVAAIQEIRTRMNT